MNILLELQKAVGPPDNKYPFPYMKGEQGYLHIWLIDSQKAAERVYNFLILNKIIMENNITRVAAGLDSIGFPGGVNISPSYIIPEKDELMLKAGYFLESDYKKD